MLLYVIFNFKKAIDLARNNIFSFWEKLLVAMILLDQKQQQKRFHHPDPPALTRPPSLTNKGTPSPAHNFFNKEIKLFIPILRCQ